MNVFIFNVGSLFVSSSEWEKKHDDETLAIVNSVATVLHKNFSFRSHQQSSGTVLDKCSYYNSKDKSMKSKLIKAKKVIEIYVGNQNQFGVHQ